MTDEPINLVLEHLRAIRNAIDALRTDMHDVKDRLSAVELGLAGVRRDIAALSETDTRLYARVDRMDDRVARIERRLDIVEGPSES